MVISSGLKTAWECGKKLTTCNTGCKWHVVRDVADYLHQQPGSAHKDLLSQIQIAALYLGVRQEPAVSTEFLALTTRLAQEAGPESEISESDTGWLVRFELCFRWLVMQDSDPANPWSTLAQLAGDFCSAMAAGQDPVPALDQLIECIQRLPDSKPVAR